MKLMVFSTIDISDSSEFKSCDIMMLLSMAEPSEAQFELDPMSMVNNLPTHLREMLLFLTVLSCFSFVLFFEISSCPAR